MGPAEDPEYCHVVEGELPTLRSPLLVQTAALPTTKTMMTTKNVDAATATLRQRQKVRPAELLLGQTGLGPQWKVVRVKLGLQRGAPNRQQWIGKSSNV